MPRKFLDVSHIHPAIRETIAAHHLDIIREVEAAIATNAVCRFRTMRVGCSAGLHHDVVVR